MKDLLFKINVTDIYFLFRGRVGTKAGLRDCCAVKKRKKERKKENGESTLMMIEGNLNCPSKKV